MNDNDDKRLIMETCNIKHKRVCNPIIDWTDDDVWDFIHSEKLDINPLYKCGYARVGCIGCPMAGKQARWREFNRYPQYKKLYIHAFDRMLQERIRKGKSIEGDWKMGSAGINVFHWWMEDGVLPGQIGFDDGEDL